MDVERAMEILDPEHREEYDSIGTVEKAMIMGRNALAMYKDNRVYACYQEYNGQLYRDYGSIDDLHFFTRKDDVFNWINNLLVWAVEEAGYVVDANIDVSNESIIQGIDSGEYRLTLFWKYQDNFDISFTIVVNGRIIED